MYYTMKTISKGDNDCITINN